MKTLFRKIEKKNVIPDGVPILFVRAFKREFLDEYIGTLQEAKNFRSYELESSWTHYLVLPKIIIKK